MNTDALIIHCMPNSYEANLLSHHVPKSLSTLTFQDDMSVSYTIKHLCPGPLGAVLRDSFPHRPTSLLHEQKMMNQCMLALSKIYTGLRTHRTLLLKDGLRLYGQGLGLLHDVLDKGGRPVMTEAIVSVISLSLGESMMPSGKSSWMIHILGLERLLESRGPLTIQNSSILDRALLEDLRPIMVLAAFFIGRPSLASKPEWRSTTLHQDKIARPDLFSELRAESDLHCLIDILAQLPTLFMERDRCLRLAEMNDLPLESGGELWPGIDLLLYRLQAWRGWWGSEHESQIHTIISNAEADGSSVDHHRTMIEFGRVRTPTAIVMYHAVTILLTSVSLSLLRARLRPPAQLVPSTDLDQHRLITAIETSAFSICRTLKHHTQLLQSSRHQRDLYLFFPIHVARRTFIHMERSLELDWLDGIYKGMLSKTSLRMWANVQILDDFIGFHREMFR